MLKTQRTLPVVLVVLVGMFALAAPANAAETKWISGLDPAPNAIWLWNDANNWNATVPADGDTISFDDADITPNPGSTPVGIDMKGADANLPAANFKKTYGARKLAYFNSDFLTPNNNPLTSQFDFTPVLPATTIQEAASASPALIIDTLNFHTDHQEHFLIPVKAKALNVGMGQPTGEGSAGVTFWGPLSAPTGESLSVVVNNSRNWRLANLHLNNTTTIDSLTVEHSAHVYFNDNTATVGALTLGGNGAVLHVNTAALTLPAVTVPAGARVQIEKMQTTWPTGMLTVAEHGSLIGDMTSADFTPGTGNVDLQDGAIFAPDADTGAPTLAQLGGTAKLYESVTTANKTLNVGHDGTTIYKGAAFDATYGSYRAGGVTVRANTGSGDLDLLYVIGAPQLDAVKLYGDESSTTANIQAVQLGSVSLYKAFNWNFRADYAAEPHLIRTINITGEQGKEGNTVLIFNGNDDKILAEQTFNVSNGRVSATQSLTGNMKGTLTLTNGIFTQPTDDFALTDGTFAIAGTTIIELADTNNLNFLENLGARFTFSGMPIVALAAEKDYALDYNPAGATPVLANLLVNADIANNSYKELRLTGDLQIGHNKYYQNSVYRSNGFNPGVTTSNGSRIIAAGNAPVGETDVLGLAALDENLNIEVEVYAPGAIVRCGTSDPTRITKAYAGLENSSASKTIYFKRTLTAAELDIQSGTAQFSVDLAIADVNIGVGTTLKMDSAKTATISGTLSGNGTFTGGNGVVIDATATVAPGASAGTLNGNILNMNTGSTYAWEFADETLAAGTGWDLVDISGLLTLGPTPVMTPRNGLSTWSAWARAALRRIRRLSTRSSSTGP